MPLVIQLIYNLHIKVDETPFTREPHVIYLQVLYCFLGLMNELPFLGVHLKQLSYIFYENGSVLVSI
ncbi:unnamed protein product [Rhizophagus irregularis]|nr:unnamed protein product [Rhizophagus irregularis]